MAYTIADQKVIEIQDFLQESIMEFFYLNIDKNDIIIQMPENHFKAFMYFIDRLFSPTDRTDTNDKVTFCGVEIHPIGYESKVVVYYKHVSYKRKELIRTMDI